MTLLSRLEAWIDAHRDELEQHGRVSFARGRSDTDNPSAHLLVSLSPESDVELLLWESGDAEFNRGPFAASVFEHVEIDSPEDFDALMRRFLDAVSEHP